MKKALFLLIIFLAAIFFCGKNTYANSFYDNFDNTQLDLTKWNYYEDYNTTVSIVNSKLTTPRVPVTSKIPFIYSKTSPFSNNFILEFKINYKTLNYGGLGLILAYSNGNILNFMNDGIQYRVFSVWQELNTISQLPLRFQVFKQKCHEWVFSCPGTETIYLNSLDKNEYKFLIKKTGNILEIQVTNLTNSLILNYPPFILDDNIEINSIFIGHPPIIDLRNGSTKYWTQLSLDYIKVDNVSSPIIFLPGYMGSFNWDDMVSGRSEHQWSRNPLEKIYDNLFATLNNVGYSENVNLFRYDYDFRRPLSETAAKFKTHLESLAAGQPAGTKFILVGHSFGGLLARTYTQTYGDLLVERVITIGSPHEGAIDSYPMIAAGESNDPNLANKAVFETILRWHGKNFITKRKVVQNLVPSLNDLIPIYNNNLFLKDTEDNFISSQIQNPYLQNLKNTFNQPDLFRIIRGNDKETNQYYRLSPRTLINTLLDDWPDGKISTIEKTNEGDGTVLKQSSTISGVAATDISSANHQDIVSKKEGIKQILENAGVPYADGQIVENPVVAPEQALLLLLKSPAEIKVTDIQTGKQIGRDAVNLIDNAIATESNKLIYIPTEEDKTYHVEVIGTGNGEYQLDVGTISVATSSSFLTFKKQITDSTIDNYDFKYAEGGNLVYLTDETIANPYESAKNMLEDLREYAATQSAVEKSEAILKINSLKADCNLIKKLFEDKHDVLNSLRQSLKMLKKTFALREDLNKFERESKIVSRNKTLNIINMEKEMFKIINNNSSLYNLTLADKSIGIAGKLIPVVEEKLLAKGAVSEFDADNFTKAQDYYLYSQKEYAAALSGQAYYSSITSRFFLNESLK